MLSCRPTMAAHEQTGENGSPPASRWVLGIPVLAWSLMALPAFFVLPSGDDWSTSSPLFSLDWDSLRPSLFWRPFEPVVRWLTGLAGAMFYPGAQHVLVVAGHAITGWFAYQILREAKTSQRMAALATALFLTMPGAGAAVWSVDSAIQTWSTGCGLWSVLLLTRRRQMRWPVAWLAPALLSMLWKESGTAWAIAAPCLAALVGSWTQLPDWRRIAHALTLGIGLLTCYLAARSYLSHSVQIGVGTGRYSLSLSPLAIGRNFGMLATAALSPIDTVALLGNPRHLGLAVMTAASGLPLLALCFWVFVTTLGAARMVLAMASLLSIAGPHILLAHVSEMYAHPLMAGALLVLVPALGPAGIGRRALWAGAGCALFGTLLSDAHKLTEMIETGYSAREVGHGLAAEHPQAPFRLCAVPAVTFQASYSVFQMAPGPASGWGASARQAWGWSSRTAYLQRSSTAECQATNADLIVSFATDGKFSLMSSPKRQEAEATTHGGSPAPK
jgi:hypothetical protein